MLLVESLNQERQCGCKRPVYFPWYLKDEKSIDEFIEKQKTNFKPEEFINEDSLIDPSKDIFYARQHLGIEPTEEDIEYINHCKVEREMDAVKWSKANEKIGGEAASYAKISTVLGIAKSVLENTDSTPQFLNTLLNMLQGITLGQRGQKQYGLYGRDDDDKGLSVYQKEHYGNKIPANLIELSCTLEKNVKPYVLPLLALLSTSQRDSALSLLTLPTTLFWRIRYSGYFDQRFSTYLMNQIIHKPLALFGNQDSKSRLEKMEEDAHIVSAGFLKERLKTLLRLKDGERADKKISLLIRDLFSGDIKKIETSAIILNETLAPILGISGFLTSAVGIPLKAITVFGFKDNLSDITNKLIESFSCLGISTQQLLYAFRFSIMEYVQSNKIREYLNETEDLGALEKQELQKLANERFNLCCTGLFGNITGIFLPLVKLIDNSNPFLSMLKSGSYEIANSSSQYFFSQRRHLKGKAFRIKNLELFEQIDHKQDNPPEEPPEQKLKLYTGE